MKILLTLIIFQFSLLMGLSAQVVGLEAQVYPTGFLLGVYGEFGFKSHHAATVRFGVNIFDHDDLGVQLDEEGHGPGGSLGYRYYFGENYTKLFLGARTDLWFNTVDWVNEQGTGTTEIVVVQPTALIGYQFFLNNRIAISPTLGLGGEINIRTQGEPTGQGAILLGGVNLGYKF